MALPTAILRRAVAPMKNTLTTNSFSFSTCSLKPLQKPSLLPRFYNTASPLIRFYAPTTRLFSSSLRRGGLSSTARFYNTGVGKSVLVHSSFSSLFRRGVLAVVGGGALVGLGMVGKGGKVQGESVVELKEGEEGVVELVKEKKEDISSGEVLLAGRGQRLIAFMIDSILGGLFCAVIPFVGWVFTVGFVVFRDCFTQNGSIGKHLMGLSIVNQKREIISFKTKFMRAFSQILSTGLLGFGLAESVALVVLNDRIGDMVLGLKVVRLEGPEPFRSLIGL